MPEVDLETLLTSEASSAGLIALYQRAMQHRTNEAMNGLSHRLDEMIVLAESNGKSQGRQQRVLNALTCVLAIATVTYTVTTVWATVRTTSDKPTSNIGASRAVPESAAVHMGVDAAGHTAVCINGLAYDQPSRNDSRLRERYPKAVTQEPVAQIRCTD